MRSRSWFITRSPTLRNPVRAMARGRAIETRRRIAEGVDPLDEKKRIATLTFQAAAEASIESKRSGWRNAKHAAQWPATLETYAYPKIGSLDVRNVGTQEIMAVLKPFWTEKPETASRVQ